MSKRGDAQLAVLARCDAANAARIDPHKGQEIRYYRESNGDYLAICYSTHKYYASAKNSVMGCRCWEGRATCISGLITSVCTTGISGTFLMGCVKVRKADVPPEWIAAMGLEEEQTA